MLVPKTDILIEILKEDPICHYLSTEFKWMRLSEFKWLTEPQIISRLRLDSNKLGTITVMYICIQ